MESHDTANATQRSTPDDALALLHKAIMILERDGRDLPAAHAQMAYDILLRETSKTD